MFKKLNQILNVVMGTSVGVWIGHGIYVAWDYHTRPGLYAMQSAPWYTSILLYGAVTLFILLAAIIIKLLIRKKIR